MGTYWIYIVGPLLGALVAALIYKLFVTDWSCCVKRDECGNPVLDECGKPIKECKRPIYDNCGNHVKDCDGKKYETYTKHERKLTHMQETPLMAIGEWMSAHGFDPRYIRQEVDHSLSGVLPNGVVQNPPAVVQNLIQGGSPTVRVASTQLMGQPTPVFQPATTTTTIMSTQGQAGLAPGVQSVGRTFSDAGQGLNNTIQSVGRGFSDAGQGFSQVPGQGFTQSPAQGFTQSPAQGFNSTFQTQIPNLQSPVM